MGIWLDIGAMATKISDFLAEKKIDPRRVLITSGKVEALRPQNRAIRLQQKLRRKDPDSAADKPKPEKPRSGRPVTRRSLDAALGGKPITGPQKTRILRAVNHILEQRKQEAVDLRALF